MSPDPGNQNRQRRGAVVLCGGGSRRMGRDKAALPFGPESMLGRVVRLAGEAVPPAHIVVIAAVGQELPPLPAAVVVVRDEAEGLGPLPALIAGLSAQPCGVEAALVVACDAPLLKPQLVEWLFDRMAAAVSSSSVKFPIDAVIPVDGERMYPLAAVYRATVIEGLERALAAGERSLHGAVRSEIAALEIAVDELREVDAHLESLMNCNMPGEYEAALERLRG